MSWGNSYALPNSNYVSGGGSNMGVTNDAAQQFNLAANAANFAQYNQQRQQFQQLQQMQPQLMQQQQMFPQQINSMSAGYVQQMPIVSQQMDMPQQQMDMPQQQTDMTQQQNFQQIPYSVSWPPVEDGSVVGKSLSAADLANTQSSHNIVHQQQKSKQDASQTNSHKEVALSEESSEPPRPQGHGWPKSNTPQRRKEDRKKGPYSPGDRSRKRGPASSPAAGKPAGVKEKTSKCPICDHVVLLSNWITHATSHATSTSQSPERDEDTLLQTLETDYLFIQDLMKRAYTNPKLMEKFSCQFCRVKNLTFDDMLKHIQEPQHMHNVYRWIALPSSNGHERYKEHVPEIPIKSRHLKFHFCEVCLKVAGWHENDIAKHVNGRVHIGRILKIRENLQWIERGNTIRNERHVSAQEEQNQSRKVDRFPDVPMPLSPTANSRQIHEPQSNQIAPNSRQSSSQRMPVHQLQGQQLFNRDRDNQQRTNNTQGNTEQQSMLDQDLRISQSQFEDRRNQRQLSSNHFSSQGSIMVPNQFDRNPSMNQGQGMVPVGDNSISMSINHQVELPRMSNEQASRINSGMHSGNDSYKIQGLGQTDISNYSGRDTLERIDQKFPMDYMRNDSISNFTPEFQHSVHSRGAGPDIRQSGMAAMNRGSGSMLPPPKMLPSPEKPSSALMNRGKLQEIVHSIRSTSTVDVDARRSGVSDMSRETARSKAAVLDLLKGVNQKVSESTYKERAMQYKREKSPGLFLQERKPPRNYDEERSSSSHNRRAGSRSPTQMMVGRYSPARRSRSPEIINRRTMSYHFTELCQEIPERLRSPSDRRKVSLERHKMSPTGRQFSPERHQLLSERFRTSPERRNHSLERRRPSPERRRLSPERRRPSSERRRPSPERRRPSPERRRPSPERRRASPERWKLSPDRRRLSIERRKLSPDRRRLSLERRDKYSDSHVVYSSTKRVARSKSPDRLRQSPERKPASKLIEVKSEKVALKKKLLPLVVDDGARQLLTKKIETTWQKYYHKYYSCVVTNPEIVLELQKEYLRSYKGFFKEDPYFEYYYIKVAKPEDLREALTLRIDRGSPGPDPNDPTTTYLNLEQSVRSRRSTRDSRSRRSRSPQRRYSRRSKSPRKRSRSPRRKAPDSDIGKSRRQLPSHEERDKLERGVQAKNRADDSINTEDVSKVLKQENKIKFERNEVKEIPISEILPVGERSDKLLKSRLPELIRNRPQVEGKFSKESSPLPPPRTSTALPPPVSKETKLPVKSEARGIPVGKTALPKTDPNVKTNSTANISVTSQFKSKQSVGIFPEASEITNVTNINTDQPSHEDRFKDRDEQISTSLPSLSRSVPQRDIDSYKSSIFHDAGHAEKPIRPTENEPVITSTTQGFPLQKKRTQADTDPGKARSVLGRLGPQRKSSSSHVKDEVRKTDNSRYGPSHRDEVSRSSSYHRRSATDRITERRKTSDQKSSNRPSISARLGQTTSKRKVQDSSITEIFSDPFLGFVHETLTGIILIGQYQKSMATNREPDELISKINSEQEQMRARMVAEDGHLLIQLARCCIEHPEAIESTFPNVNKDIGPILRNMDKQVITLIADTPIIIEEPKRNY